MTLQRRALLVGALALPLSIAACKGDGSQGNAGATASAAPETEVVVFAAASLGEAFRALEPVFVGRHPGAKVTFQLAGSQELRTQIEHGASADVFASADTAHMDALVTQERVIDPRIFARNEPVMVVASNRKADLATFADLPKAERIVVGEATVPIGRYTGQILDKANATLGADFRARVDAKVISRELNVKQVLAKVTLGEADAGIVYRTDARAAKDVAVVVIPPELNVVATYPIARVERAAHPDLGRAFVALVLSAEGRAVLAEHGFGVDAEPPR